MKKKIVVTGASKGIGKAIALYFGAQGFDVAICARDVQKLEAVAAEIRAMGAQVNCAACLRCYKSTANLTICRRCRKTMGRY
jgi:short-subunit dehydrogenase